MRTGWYDIDEFSENVFGVISNARILEYFSAREYEYYFKGNEIEHFKKDYAERVVEDRLGMASRAKILQNILSYKHAEKQYRVKQNNSYKFIMEDLC